MPRMGVEGNNLFGTQKYDFHIDDILTLLDWSIHKKNKGKSFSQIL